MLLRTDGRLAFEPLFLLCPRCEGPAMPPSSFDDDGWIWDVGAVHVCPWCRVTLAVEELGEDVGLRVWCRVCEDWDHVATRWCEKGFAKATDPESTTLAISLAAAVPMHAAELRRQPWCIVEGTARAAASEVAEKGDVILFQARKSQGKTAKAFNALARGLACLAFLPGGVQFLGRQFEYRHPGRRRSRAA